MAFQNVDLEALLREDSELLPDVTFKVYDNDSVLVQDGDADQVNLVTWKIFRAHKFLLAAVSPMLLRQFYGSLPQTVEPVCVERTSSKAFGVMLNFLYQKSGQFAFPSDHFACLFEVKNLAEKYQIADLVKKTDFEISIRRLNPQNLIEAAKSAKRFQHLFPEISNKLIVRCISFFTSHYKTAEKIRELLNNHNDSQFDTDICVMLIKSKPTICDGCKQSYEVCLDNERVTEENVVVGARVLHIQKTTTHGTAIVMGKDERYVEVDGVPLWHIFWEHSLTKGSWVNLTGGYFVFKCDKNWFDHLPY